MKSVPSLIIAFLATVTCLAAPRPNILVILTDDAGYADFGFQGGGRNGDYANLTPHLDRLAATGARFTSGYVTQPYCCPSRAGLLTGRYQQRFGFENNILDFGATAGLATNELTVANRLKARGYTTFAIGKWHMGENTNLFHPNLRGFDHFLGFFSGGRSYFGGDETAPADILHRNFTPANEPPGQYLTDRFALEATNYIASHVATNGGSPFFMYLAFNGVHKPMHAKASDLANSNVVAIANLHRQTNAAMTLAVDRAVGAVMNQLTNSQIHSNTLVVFLNDNGGPEDGGSDDLPDELRSPNWSDNGPLRGRKTSLYEGGIRVPFVIHWLGRIPPQVIDDPVIALDLLPTFISAAGGTNSPASGLDGIDLLPRLTGVTTNPIRRCLFWRSRLPIGEFRAARQGDWKLYRPTNGVAELYHLPTDIGETNDLAAALPEKVAELSAALAEWERGLILPLWAFGAPTNSANLRFTASDLGYRVENTSGGFSYMGHELSAPLSLSNDWTLTWRMESEAVPGYGRNGYILLSDRPIQRGTNIIRAGLELALPASTLSIRETDPSHETTRAIPGPLAATYYFRLDYSATNRALRLRYGTNQPALRYETGRVVHFLAGNYGPIRFAGYSLQGLARTHFSTLLSPPNPLAPATSPSWTRLQAASDYTAGSLDTNGNFMGGTELMSLVPHKGKLYAGLSYWNETHPHPGAQVLVKDSATSPWRVDKAFGSNLVRVECLRSLTITTDKNTNALDPHVTLLLAGVSFRDGVGAATNAAVFVRDDLTGEWTLTTPGAVGSGHAAARFLFDHKDRQTGVHHVFCGFGEVKLVRGGYDANLNTIVWDSATPELIGSERMLSGGDCNGWAYACIGSDGNPANNIGGVFWREDGADPRWHFITEFPDHPDEQYEDVRGFTAVPHPKGFGYDVALITLNSHSKVVRLDPVGGDPRNGHILTEELNIETFLGDLWSDGTPITDNIIAAYNDMPALLDPATGQQVNFLGLFIKRHPAGTNTVEFHNTFYLIRRLDATYDWGLIADPANPVPYPLLRSCRAARLSPFPSETDRILYLGGHDAGANDPVWHNTAWLYRAQLADDRALLRMDGSTPVPGIHSTFGWNYQLEASPTLTNFQSIGPSVPGSNTLHELRHTNAAPAHDFYRWKISR